MNVRLTDPEALVSAVALEEASELASVARDARVHGQRDERPLELVTLSPKGPMSSPA
jgi:hypothetical protein